MTDTDRLFVGSMPEFYDRYLGPALFEPFAGLVASRVAGLGPRRVLELAAGTGVLTAAMASAMPDAAITATDLNQPMLDRAAALRPARNVIWRQADAQDLPFPERTFDLVVCQFGAMFFPDRPAAYAEARRVLSPRGQLVLAVWDSLARNAFPRVMSQAVGRFLDTDEPQFVERIPHGYHDVQQIQADLAVGGFESVGVETVSVTGHAKAFDVARGFLQGSPLQAAFGSADQLERAIDAVTEALRTELGGGGQAISGELTAHLVIAS
jgi:ubiquinone/menaquinone biosynthesis C-methylase UbiE